MASSKGRDSREPDVSSAASGIQALSLTSHSLKMLTDKRTEMYVKFAKVMVIFQGPYNMIRTKALKSVKDQFAYASSIVSDESYAGGRSSGCFYEETEDFYEYFKSESRKSLEEGSNLLVLDPTMSNLGQNAYYLALAHKMQYVVLIVPPVVTGSERDHSWPSKSLAMSYREVKTYIQPCNMFQHLFCGWFLHDIDSVELRHEAALYAQDCLESFPEFKEMFSSIFTRYVQSSANDKKVSPDNGKEFSEMSFMEMFNHYFNLEEQRQDLAHCVVKVFRDLFRGMNEYFQKTEVAKVYGKMSKMFIAGFIISPHMIAARVKLTKDQKELWEMEDELDAAAEISLYPSDLLKKSKENLPDIDVQLICSKSNTTLINTKRTVHDPMDSIPQNAKGRACHFLLGKARGAPVKNVDYDVAFALRRERDASKFNTDVKVEELERCIVKKIGKYWYIYLRETLCVDGFFASCCKAYAYETAL